MNPNEKYNVFDLQESHKNLLGRYLTFFKTKQEKFVKEVKLVMEDYKEQNLKEMMFSKQEVEDLIDELKENVSNNMDNEISYYLNMNAIFVQLLLHEADKSNITLKAETSQVQNLQNVNEMNEFIKSINTINLPTEFGKSNVISKLGAISKTQNLISDYESLKHEYEMLNQNYQILKNQNELLIKENNNLQSSANDYSEEVNTLRSQLMKLSTNNTSNSNVDNINKLQSDLEGLKKNLNDQVAKYQNLLKEYDVKLSESIQFQQLKKFLQEKNALIIDLKNKVAKYEEALDN